MVRSRSWVQLPPSAPSIIYAIIKSALIIRLNNKNMRVKIVLSVLGLFLFLGAAGAAFAQEELPGAGLTPASPFYFLDRLGETLREFFTFNSQAKARLQITFAAERVAEIKIILETKGVEARGLEVAQARLQANLAKAAAIVEERKSKGEDVSGLAKELDEKLETPKSALARSFKEQKRASEAKEDELKIQLKAALRAGDAAQEEALAQELGKVKAQKELLELKEEDIEDELEAEEEKIEEELEAPQKAEKAIREAEEEKQEVIGEAAEEGIELPAEVFSKFDRLLAQAKELFAKENYQGAKQLARQAEDALEDVDREIEKLEKEKERQEERARKEEERKQGEEEKMEEESRENEKERREAAAKPRTFEVEIRNGRFDPPELKIKKGDTVIWTNASSRQVWPASAVHPTHQELPGFDSLRGISADESYSFRFDKPGSWRYHDHLNPALTGVVQVSE